MAGMKQQVELGTGWGISYVGHVLHAVPSKTAAEGPLKKEDANDGWGPQPHAGLTALQAGLPVDPWTGCGVDQVTEHSDITCPTSDEYVMPYDRFQIRHRERL